MTAAVQLDLLELLADLPEVPPAPRVGAMPTAPTAFRHLASVPTVASIEAGGAEVPVGERDWQDRSVCNKIGDDDFWFPPYSGQGTPPRQDEAREVCQNCPVMRSCAANAYRHPAGITGYRAGVYCGPNPDVMPKRAYRGLYAAAVHDQDVITG